MQEYIDDKYLVANGIILTYSGEEEDVVVPSQYTPINHDVSTQ